MKDMIPKIGCIEEGYEATQYRCLYYPKSDHHLSEYTPDCWKARQPDQRLWMDRLVLLL